MKEDLSFSKPQLDLSLAKQLEHEKEVETI
jgi:hypothetical protein